MNWRKALGWWGIFIGVAGIIGIVVERRAANRQAERIRAMTWREESPRTLQPGDRVRIARRAGTFKPAETGAASEVVAGHGQTGVVVGWEKRQSDGCPRIDPHEPLQIVRVRWSPQRWKEFGLADRWIELPEFEATIHVSYLSRE
jgi:hypothetical protein